MVKKLLIILIVLAFLVIGAAFGGLLWWNNALEAPFADKTEKSFLIVKGASADTIGKKLKAEGFIKNELAFKLYLRKEGLGNKIPPGEFTLPQNLDVPGLVNKLLEGPTEVWVTIREGLRLEQVPSRFAAGINLPEDKTEAFIDSFFLLASDMEGYLYPDTYLVPKDLTAQQAVNMMKATFDKKYQSITPQTNTTLTPAEIVILASLIERETRNNGDERQMVAGILMNRLSIDMPLQVDASVQYVLANMRCKPLATECEDWWPTVLRGDYTLKAAYSTYANTGLPPAPIANPGFSSLSAALNPKDNDYVYYIHDKTGQIHYAETLEEHNNNVSRYIN